ncbi:uncharacterized protein LOC112094829 [Morus notabilis]|uniref:uncharacterized protein LOC112094829 n=1 Tax=Morus notabilis TaxID=981085 RepID=UPI000CECFF5C|nr:uncharacterized protein LOC112094829 [Morus notabilis]
MAIKGQALADFLAEFSHRRTTDTDEEVNEIRWKLYVDGASNETGSGADVMLISPDGHKITSAVRFIFKASNNEAEYEALIAGVQLTNHLKIEKLKIFSDSQLVVGQVTEEYQARGEKMGAYLRKLKEELTKFKSYEIRQVPRAENTNTDALAKLASSKDSDLLGVIPIKELERPTIDEAAEVLTIQTTEDWMTPLIRYLMDAELPSDRDEARRIKYRAARYLLYDGLLYRRGFSMPLQRCLNDHEAQEVLREIYEGVCGNHTRGQSLALKVLRQGFAIVAVDYYTKWAEAKALTTTTKAACTNFIWNNIVCKFRVPHSIVSDNGKQFDNASTRKFCDDFGIRKDFSVPIHPQSNGQVEAINKILKYTLKKKLDDLKGKWAEELPKVLWAYRTTSQTTTGETPFSMAYGIDVVLPVKIETPTLRTVVYNADLNIEAMDGELDLLKEKRLDS